MAASPETYHRKRHVKRGAVRPETTVDECWYCQRQRAVCKSKIRWHNLNNAIESCEDLNILRSWKGSLVLPYKCIWCPGWHTHTARSTRDKKRVERWRRKHIRNTMLK